MQRSHATEILDAGGLSDAVVARSHRELTRIHRALGDTRAVCRAIRRDPLPVRRVLDVGCGHGGVLAEIRARLGVEVIGADLCPPSDAPVPIVRADAVRDPLPRADVAISLCLGHHLSEADLAAVIRNVGRSCRRFLLVDLIRHPLPLALFRVFVWPLLSPVSGADGVVSIQRAYTPDELTRVAARAGVRFRHSIAPFYASQTLDITY